MIRQLLHGYIVQSGHGRPVDAAMIIAYINEGMLYIYNGTEAWGVGR